MTNIDPKEIYVYAATSDKFAETAKAYMGPWYECLALKAPDYDLAQIVLYKKEFWLGAFLWRRAQCQSYPRDRFLGWHACQQAERLPLVIECLGFQPMHHSPDQPNYGCIALNAALLSLQPDWVDYFGYVPLLVDTHLKASSGFASYFKEAGWTRTTDKNPRAAASHWAKELVPDARAIITAKHLDKAYTGVASPYVDGLLPIQDELLSSFQAAFKEVHDPRENNSHYPLHTLWSCASGRMFRPPRSISY
ncbi:hypothetical protein [Pontiella sulfatireligans]|uniref:Uncharacterized protein n=1 Tax=Pontiella sulfatireligans TaxID=2750658 RepID=A0A6C2UFU6_9BACT|nr:hypothetical protein [Pontiella sulfatireligans]VGO18789.1 hypothetical protein SCARR_00842 [Pontiella sulfatireligans]